MYKNKRYWGIKYPFTINNEDGLFIDLNESPDDLVLSNILHVLLTPKGERLRMPDFGTDLIKYIFSPNDTMGWDSVYEEMHNAINKYVKNARINKIDIMKNEENDNEIYIVLDYGVIKGESVVNKKITVQI